MSRQTKEPMNSRLWFAALAGFVLTTSAASSPVDPSQEEIAREFQSICLQLKRSHEPHWGELPMEMFESQLRAEESLDEPDLQRAALLRVRLARELIEFGRSADAIEVLDGKYFAALESKPILSNAATGLDADSESIEAGPSDFASPSITPLSADNLSLAWLELRLEAHLKAAEDQNCFFNHTASSCILPFDEGAVHSRPDHARKAGDLASRILSEHPDHIVARWLLNLMRMASRDFPDGVPEEHRLPDSALQSASNFPRWPNRALDVGVGAFDLAGGAIMDDFDGDGLLDLVSSTSDPCDSLKAFRNDGRGGFEDVTEAWGLDIQLGGLNLVHADYDGDGALDLLVLRGGWQHKFGMVRNSLLRNELSRDTGRFVDVTHSTGLADPEYPTQAAAFSDYDLDGDLDLYIGNETIAKNRLPSQLLRNEDGSHFIDVTERAGVENLRMAKGVAWGDYDDDGDPDLYVSNIGYNRLYRNNGGGQFTDVALDLDVVHPYRRSFATWFFDYNNDGKLDLFVADYDVYYPKVMASFFGKRSKFGHPQIYRNDGGSFREISLALGLSRPFIPMGANYGDLDNDGWLDLYLGTGEPSYQALVPNVMLRNVQGVRFSDVSFAAGVAHLQKGHGVAFGDLDNDGDQDLFHQLGGFYPGDQFSNALFENPGGEANWITLRLQGKGLNRFGVGARIEVRVESAGHTRSIYALVGSGGSFGGSSMQQEIGLGDAERIVEIRIRWPGNSEIQIHRDIAMNRIYHVVEDGSPMTALDIPAIRLGAPE